MADERDRTVLLAQPLTAADAGELLTLQRATFVSEALVYGDPTIPALTQSLDDLQRDLQTTGGLAVRAAGRLIAAVRLRQAGPVVHITRLMVAPDLQGRGLGSELLSVAEARTDAAVAEVVTGHRSQRNLLFFESRGYSESTRFPMKSGITMVALRKQLRSAAEE